MVLWYGFSGKSSSHNHYEILGVILYPWAVDIWELLVGYSHDVGRAVAELNHGRHRAELSFNYVGAIVVHDVDIGARAFDDGSFAEVEIGAVRQAKVGGRSIFGGA